MGGAGFTDKCPVLVVHEYCIPHALVPLARLRILGVDYSVKDFIPYTPLGLTVTVDGNYYELCPASSMFGSASSCEYIIAGYQDLSVGQGDCCPLSVTAYGTPARLQALAAAVGH